MEYRLGVLEKHFEKLDGKIDKLLDQAAATNVRLAAIDVKLDAKAAVTDISKIETRLASIDAKLDAKAAQKRSFVRTGKIEKFVDKWFVLKTCLWMFVALSGVIAAMTLFQTQIKAVFGIH